MKCIVISSSLYKDKDLIVNCVSEKGLITFAAKSAYDVKKKFSFLSNQLSIIDVELVEGVLKYPVLKSCELISSPLKAKSELTYLSCVLLISELTFKGVEDSEKELIYDSLLKTSELLPNCKQPLIVLLKFLLNYLSISGFDIDFNHCALCGGVKSIKSFSFEDGGFICSDCFNDKQHRPLTINQLLALRKVALTNDFEKLNQEENNDNILPLIKMCLDFIDDELGVKLLNSKLLFN